MQKPLRHASAVQCSWILASLALTPAACLEAQIVNPNFSWNSTVIVPGSSANFTAPDFTYPDGVTRRTNNYVFKSGTASVWKLNSGALVTCREDYPYIANRFFIGHQDGSAATLTFTTDTLLKPGVLCARGDSNFSVRVGEAATNSQGTLVVDGGVRVQFGQCYGEGPSPAIHIKNGRLDVFTGNPLKRLNGISITLGPKGKLWLEDPSATIKNLASFSTFATSAALSAPGGSLVFTNHVEGYPYWGNAGVSGTLISVNASTDDDGDGLPDAWENLYQLDPADNGGGELRNGPDGDPDGDGSTNAVEFQRDTNPLVADTDNDGLLDGAESLTSILISSDNTGTDPRNSDSDNDSLPDGVEVLNGSNPNDADDPGYDADRDHDGLPNVWEIAHQLDPDENGSTHPMLGPEGDPDNDGVSNAEEFRMDSDPRVNESGYAFSPRPSKIGTLVVFAHPDDEGIAFGGAIPYYAKVKDMPTILLSMTSGDYNTAPRVREQQLRAAAWTYGIPYQPLFPRFKDQPTDVNATWDLWADGVLNGNDVAAGRLKAAMWVAKVIRTYRPEIIFTHGTNGEYGHNDHIATCQSVIEAWSLASDPTIEIDNLPVWKPQKLYLHEWNQHRLFHDYWETPSTALGGKTPRETTLAGLKFHYNQANVSTVFLTGEIGPSMEGHPSEWWGLYATNVGYDTPSPDFNVAGENYSGWAKGDFLEHVTLPTHAAPLIAIPPAIDCEYPWSAELPAVVTDETPVAGLSFAWAGVSGPSQVTFSPSATVRNPTAKFTKAGRYVVTLSVSDGEFTSTRELTINVLPKAAELLYAINCGGGSFTSSDGVQWAADQFHSGGSVIDHAPLSITGTADDPLFQSQRRGSFSYALPLPTGSYRVTLRMAEAAHALPGLRRFHINLEGQRVATSLDPCATAGRARAFDRSYSVNVSGGTLDLQFLPEIDQPSVAAIMVSAIEPDIFVPPPPPPVLPAALLLLPQNLDTDGDGISDRDEFIAGTESTVPDASPFIFTQNPVPPHSFTIGFQTRVADGADYAGFRRCYRVEQSTSLDQGSWSPVWSGDGDGQWKEISVSPDAESKFYRLATCLVPAS